MVEGRLLPCDVLGWDAPLLHSAAVCLLGMSPGRGEGVLSISRSPPGARTGRRLKEFLVDRAAENGRVRPSPEVIAFEQLPERFYRSD